MQPLEKTEARMWREDLNGSYVIDAEVWVEEGALHPTFRKSKAGVEPWGRLHGRTTLKKKPDDVSSIKRQGLFTWDNIGKTKKVLEGGKDIEFVHMP